MDAQDKKTTVFTAVSLETAEATSTTTLATPLLVDYGADDESSQVDNEATNLFSSFRILGFVLGFLAQVINVLGTTLMYMRWGTTHLFLGGGTHSLDEGIAHFVLWSLTQVDLILYIIMWVTLTAIMTREGMDYVRNTFFRTDPNKRSVFILGVQFYVGVVVGVLLSWMAVDIFLGLPVPLFPMFIVLIFGLIISYTMIWCYDLEADAEGNERLDDSESGEYAMKQ